MLEHLESIGHLGEIVKRKCRFILPGADGMRATTGATPNRLAGASGCSLETTQLVLAEVPRTRNVCERIVNGLRHLGHQTVAHSDIKETA
jgi:hypothetical protein